MRNFFGILVCFLFLNSLGLADQKVGPAALKHAKKAKIIGEETESKVTKLMAYLATNPLHDFAPSPQKDPSSPPPLPKGGTHPYEWDSLRSAEEMLESCEGGTCGTYGLSAAAMLRASGIKTEEISILGAVLNSDYKELCTEKGQNFNTDTRSGLGGHVFLQIKIAGTWYLLNTTHQPLRHPIDKNSPSFSTFQLLIKGCRERFPMKNARPDPRNANDAKFLLCAKEAEKEGLARLTFKDLEIIPFYSPDQLAAQMEMGPVQLPMNKFPSLNDWMGGNKDPRMMAFANWSFENYPKHTFDQRKNLVASGKIDNTKCRYSASDLEDLPNSTTEPKPEATILNK